MPVLLHSRTARPIHVPLVPPMMQSQSTSDRLAQPRVKINVKVILVPSSTIIPRIRKEGKSRKTLYGLQFSIHQKLLNVSQYLDCDSTWFSVS
jgi:hypothetical protein